VQRHLLATLRRLDDDGQTKGSVAAPVFGKHANASITEKYAHHSRDALKRTMLEALKR
jgi:hypothetical protein